MDITIKYHNYRDLTDSCILSMCKYIFSLCTSLLSHFAVVHPKQKLDHVRKHWDGRYYQHAVDIVKHKVSKMLFCPVYLLMGYLRYR